MNLYVLHYIVSHKWPILLRVAIHTDDFGMPIILIIVYLYSEQCCILREVWHSIGGVIHLHLEIEYQFLNESLMCHQHDVGTLCIDGTVFSDPKQISHFWMCSLNMCFLLEIFANNELHC